MDIDIIIPTYNRGKYLIRNLNLIKEIIEDIPSHIHFGILVTDNNSNDDTEVLVRDYVANNPDVNLRYYRQLQNIGYTRNLLYGLSKSSADYVITLGDDDYLDPRYLDKSIAILSSDKYISCILPAFEGISESGEHLGIGRDLGMKSKLYKSGIDNAQQNIIRAHQISGIILKRSGIYDIIKRKRLTNLYIQMFMVGYSCLKGKCYHLPEYPVLVTQTNKKAWKYDDIGLLGDIFENIRALDISERDRLNFELEVLDKQRWRALKYWKNPIKQLQVIFKVSFHKNTSLLGHIVLPIVIFYFWIKFSFMAIYNKITTKCLLNRN